MRNGVIRSAIAYMSVVVFGLMLTCLSSAQTNRESMVGMWLFDEEDNIVMDYSENGNDGEIVGEPEVVDGRFGMAITCDPSNYVSVPDSPSLDITDELTVMAWVNVSSSHAGQVVMKATTLATTTTIYGFQVWDDGHPYCHVITDTGWTEIDGGDYPLDEWFHLAMTFGGDRLKFYMDGDPMSEFPTVGEIATNDDPFMIGGGHTFNGIIDEVGVFNAALSEDEINAIVTKGLDEALNLTAVSAKGKLATAWGSVKQEY